MTRTEWITLGTVAGVGAVFGGSLLASRRASASTAPAATPGPLPPFGDLPLPRATDVRGDLTRNWGTTPADLRPLFLRMEEVSRIVGCARPFAVFAYRESRFVPTAHNGDAESEGTERDASARAYHNNKVRNPALTFGHEAAAFGSGGLFGLLAPYFLWTGVNEVGERAPLLDEPPESMFQPRIAAFAAVTYLQRIVANYRTDDIADVRAGWASPSLLTSGRGGETYQEVRARFFSDAQTVGIDLDDTQTIPSRLDASAWPGVLTVFAQLVGALPNRRIA